MIVPESINLIGMSFDELMSLFFLEIDDDDYYDVIAIRMAAEYRDRLTDILNTLSGRRLRAALIGFRFTKPNDYIVQKTKEYLSHGDDRIVVAAMDTLRHCECVGFEEVGSLFQHKSPHVRGAYIRFARERLGVEAIPLLIASLGDEDSIVRENALDELDGLADADILPLIEPLLNDENPAVRQAASSLWTTIGKD